MHVLIPKVQLTFKGTPRIGFVTDKAKAPWKNKVRAGQAAAMVDYAILKA